ncbi:MAG: GNAT family N-acetyltransferase [Pseudomonadales bacterium]|nr:GNAT family N-acetyltransferase [Pseudomonadales bacterium]
MATIKRITTQDTYALRQRILRPHQSLDHCQYPGDLDSTTVHYGVINAQAIVGILSLYRVNHEEIDIPQSWQLRAMATCESARGKGYGIKLIEKAESYIKSGYTHCILGQCIWANARTSALGFYQKLGYLSVGPEFDIPAVGPHYLCYKKLP